MKKTGWPWVSLLIVGALCGEVARAQGPAAQAFNATCARVDNVNDGDTFVCVRSNGTRFSVRVAAVDAPETGLQRGAGAAGKRLRELASDGSRVVCSGKRSGKRWVCRVFTPQQQDVGALLLEAGAVWYYTQFANQVPPKHRTLYKKLQTTAQAKGAGLWGDDQPMPPWQCRRNREIGKSCR
jgi:micrococcal nuclease